MKALILEKPGRIRMADVPKPKPGPKDVVSRVCYSGICATDMALLDGTLFAGQPEMVRYPIRIGHEWSGIVEEVGSEVTGFSPGDKVVGDDSVPCGDCLDCLSGNYLLCPNVRSVGTVGNAWPGSFAEYMLMPSRLMYKLNNDADMQEAALIEPAGNVFSGLRKADIRVGDVVVVVGTGAIGLAGAALAHSFGASKVILVGRRDAKLEIGRQMGADLLVNATKENVAQVIKEQTWLGLGADAVIETSGNPEAFRQALSYLRTGGSLSAIGFYEQTIPNFDIDNLVISGFEIKGAGGAANAYTPIIRLMNEKRVSLKPLVSAVYPADEYARAFDHVRENDDRRIKVLIELYGGS